jgi:hypothetical protein
VKAGIITAVLISFIAPCVYAELVLLSIPQPFSLGNNTTLVIEDVDAKQGVVWLNICYDNRTVDSAVIGIGGHHVYGGSNLTLQKIYSGGNNDLVALDIENETGLTNMTYGDASFSNVTQSPVSAVLTSERNE